MPSAAPGPSTRTPAHEVRDFLLFLSLKRDLFAAEIASIFAEFAEERLGDDMFSRDEVQQLLRELGELAAARVRRDHDAAAAMSGLVVEQVLVAAESAGLGALALDLSRTEDAASLERMRNLNSVLLAPGGGRGGARLDATAGRLEGLREEHARLKEERDGLRAEAAALRASGAALQERCAGLQAERDEQTQQQLREREEAGRLRAGLAEAQQRGLAAGGAAAAASASAVASSELAARLEATRAELAAAVRERDSRLAESKQFLQLKQLMARKNAQLAELRQRLGKYEPDAAAAGDLDAEGGKAEG